MYCDKPDVSRPPEDLRDVEPMSIPCGECCGGLVVRDAEIRGSPEGVVKVPDVDAMVVKVGSRLGNCWKKRRCH